MFRIVKPSTIKVKFTRPLPERVNITFYNREGDIFFFRELGGKYDEIKVNIPMPGIYEIDNGYIDEIKPIEISPIIKNIQLPEHERTPEQGIKTTFTRNDSIYSPARIFRKSGRIEKGPKWYNLPYSLRLFILLHEHGHFYYRTEWKCDLFALYHFLKMGYNESSAIYSLTRILNENNPENKDRILKLFKTLTT